MKDFLGKNQATLILIAFLGFGLLGCEESINAPGSQPVDIPAEEMYELIRNGYALIYEPFWGVPDGYEPTEEEAGYVNGGMSYDFADISRNSPDWQTAHAKAIQLLEEKINPVGVGNESMTEFPLFVKEQLAAVDMLTRSYGEGHPPSLLVVPPMTREKQEAIGFYLNLLVKNNSPHVDIGLEALQLMDGYWADVQISQVADALIDGYMSKYGEERSAAKMADLEPSGKKAYHERLQRAVTELETMLIAN